MKFKVETINQERTKIQVDIYYPNLNIQGLTEMSYNHKKKESFRSYNRAANDSYLHLMISLQWVVKVVNDSNIVYD